MSPYVCVRCGEHTDLHRVTKTSSGYTEVPVCKSCRLISTPKPDHAIYGRCSGCNIDRALKRGTGKCWFCQGDPAPK